MMNPLSEYRLWKSGQYPASVDEWEDWAERIIRMFEAELKAVQNDDGRHKELKATNAALLEALMQVNSYLADEFMGDSEPHHIGEVVSEAIRKAKGE